MQNLPSFQTLLLKLMLEEKLKQNQTISGANVLGNQNSQGSGLNGNSNPLNQFQLMNNLPMMGVDMNAIMSQIVCNMNGNNLSQNYLNFILGNHFQNEQMSRMANSFQMIMNNNQNLIRGGDFSKQNLIQENPPKETLNQAQPAKLDETPKQGDSNRTRHSTSKNSTTFKVENDANRTEHSQNKTGENSKKILDSNNFLNFNNYFICEKNPNQCFDDPEKLLNSKEKLINRSNIIIDKKNADAGLDINHTVSEDNQDEILDVNCSNLENSEGKKQGKIKYFPCTIENCNKIFPKECNLKDHIRTHTGEKPFRCEFPNCGRSFSQHGNLKKHFKVHKGDKKFYCTFPRCGKKFSASYNLKIHFRSHTGDKPYKCTIDKCHRSFYDKGNLKYHEKTYHQNESIEQPYACEHMGCNMKFKSKKLKLIHHNKMEPDCNKEKVSLIKLIKKFKEFLHYLSKDRSIEFDSDVYESLKKSYQDAQDKLIENDFFLCVLGQNFDDPCVDDNKLNEIIVKLDAKENQHQTDV